MCISNNRTNGAICQAFCNTNCNLRRAADDLEDFSKKMNVTLDKSYIDLNGVSVKFYCTLSCQEDEHKFNRKEKPKIARMRNGRIRDSDVPVAILSVNFWVARYPH